MTKKYIVPCVMEVVEPDNATQGCIRTQIGPWGFMVKRTEDTLDILNVVGVEIDFEKMARLAKRSEKFTRDKFLKDFTDSVREALNWLVNGETK